MREKSSVSLLEREGEKRRESKTNCIRLPIAGGDDVSGVRVTVGLVNE